MFPSEQPKKPLGGEEENRLGERLKAYIRTHRAAAVVGSVTLFALFFIILTMIFGGDKGRDMAGGNHEFFYEHEESDEFALLLAELDENFEGFTHFPIDFAAAFANPEQMSLRSTEGEGSVEMWRLPVTMFFNPPHKIIGARKWYFKHPHIPETFDDHTGTVVADWPIYLVADGIVRIEVDRDRHGNDVYLESFEDLNVEDLYADEAAGKVVYRGMSVGAQITKDISVFYDRLRLRKEIVDAVIAGGGLAFFPAGTVLAYGGSSMWAFDDRVDASPYPPGVNPFDYFTPEKQQELLELYQPVYEILQSEGTHPFSDIAKSDLQWDVPGILEGAWVREEVEGNQFHGDGAAQDIINLVGINNLNAETYWRVLEHPWNVENNIAGLFVENPEGGQPNRERMLYDFSALDQPLHESRFYLLDGDLSDGLAMIISSYAEAENGQWAWDPIVPDGAGRNNHPSNGARRYLRFSVDENERLTIQGFLTEAQARAGFTEEAVGYKRAAPL